MAKEIQDSYKLLLTVTTTIKDIREEEQVCKLRVLLLIKKDTES